MSLPIRLHQNEPSKVWKQEITKRDKNADKQHSDRPRNNLKNAEQNNSSKKRAADGIANPLPDRLTLIATSTGATAIANVRRNLQEVPARKSHAAAWAERMVFHVTLNRPNIILSQSQSSQNRGRLTLPHGATLGPANKRVKFRIKDLHLRSVHHRGQPLGGFGFA